MKKKLAILLLASAGFLCSYAGAADKKVEIKFGIIELVLPDGSVKKFKYNVKDGQIILSVEAISHLLALVDYSNHIIMLLSERLNKSCT